MAQPKKKKSKSRQGIRRQNHSLKAPVLIVCKTCGKKAFAHTICAACDTYNK